MEIAPTYKQKLFWRVHSLKVSEMEDVIEVDIREIGYLLYWTGMRSCLICDFQL
jgi:hypothetical protein